MTLCAFVAKLPAAIDLSPLGTVISSHRGSYASGHILMDHRGPVALTGWRLMVAERRAQLLLRHGSSSSLLQWHGMPPTNVKQLAGDPAGLLRGKEQDDVGHVLRLSDPAQRGLRGQPLCELRRDVARLHRAQGHHVDRYPERAQLSGGGPAVALQRMLAGAVGDLAGEAGGAIRAHVNDATPPRSSLRVAPGILGHHQGHGAAVHGEVLIVALSRDSEGADTSSSMTLRA